MGVASSTKDVPASKAAATDSRWMLVRRVVKSSTFAKSERLSSFLLFICELTLGGRASEINEQKIGTSVFGRAPDYDSSIDGIVRPQASRLRQRLDLYFTGEGAQEPVRITLPRGSYVPVFEPHTTAKLPIEPKPDPQPVVRDTFSVAHNPRSRLSFPQSLTARAAVLVLLLVLITAFVARTIHPKTEVSISPAVHPLWSVLFGPNGRTMVVPSDTGLVMWQGATHKTVDLAGYLSGDYRATSAGDKGIGKVDAADLASRRYTSIVDLNIVKGLTCIADGTHSSLDVRYARDLRPNDLKDGNIILIGAAAANPWVELLEPKLNFIFSKAHIRQYTILNRHPLGAEPSEWNANYDDPQHHVYGVVAFLPNLSGKGSVLLLEGTSMAGTEGAWDFVGDESSLLPFLNRIKRPDGTLPHFQLVLDSTNLTGSSVKPSVLAYRVTN